MGRSSEETNISLVKRVLHALGANDMRPLISSLADNVVWKSNSLSSYFRFGGLYLNRAGVLDLLAKVSSEFSFSHFDVDKIAACGDEVWAICNVKIYEHATKRSAASRMALFVVVRDGKILSYESFFDTAWLLQQLGRLPGPAVS